LRAPRRLRGGRTRFQGRLFAKARLSAIRMGCSTSVAASDDQASVGLIDGRIALR